MLVGSPHPILLVNSLSLFLIVRIFFNLVSPSMFKHPSRHFSHRHLAKLHLLLFSGDLCHTARLYGCWSRFGLVFKAGACCSCFWLVSRARRTASAAWLWSPNWLLSRLRTGCQIDWHRACEAAGRRQLVVCEVRVCWVAFAGLIAFSDEDVQMSPSGQDLDECCCRYYLYVEMWCRW